MNNLDDLALKDIKLISHLPRMNSIRKYSKEVNLTPAFISKRIKQLEEVLNSQLIDRSVKGITITEQGKQYSLWARKLIEKSEEIQKYRIGSNSNYTSYLNIGMRGFLNTTLIGAFTQSIQNKGLRFIDLSPNDTDKITSKGSLDITITIQEKDFGKNWHCEHIGKMKWSVYARADHELQTLQLNEIINYKIAFATYYDGTTIISGDDFLNIPPELKSKGHGIQTATTAIALAKHTDQLIYIPDIVALEDLNDNKLKQIPIVDQKY